jgi:hypothetical protein
MVSCEACGKRNGSAAAKCWSCDEAMTSFARPAWPTFQRARSIAPSAGTTCGRRARRRRGPSGAKLFETPSGAALIAAFGKVSGEGRRLDPHSQGMGTGRRAVVLDNNGDRWELPEALRAARGRRAVDPGRGWRGRGAVETERRERGTRAAGHGGRRGVAGADALAAFEPPRAIALDFCAQFPDTKCDENDVRRLDPAAGASARPNCTFCSSQAREAVARPGRGHVRQSESAHDRS